MNTSNTDTPAPTSHLIVGDMHALVEDFIQSSEHTYMLSLIGSQVAIKAIRAKLGKGERGVLRHGTQWTSVYMPDAKKLKMDKLCTGRHLGVVSSERMLDGFALVAEREEDLPRAFRGAFAKLSRIPTHPSWAAWMWAQARELEAVTPLRTRQRSAYLVGDLAGLEVAIRYGVRSGELCAPSTGKAQMRPSTGEAQMRSSTSKAGCVPSTGKAQMRSSTGRPGCA